MRTHTTVFYPDVLVLFRKRHLVDGILGKDTGMRLTIVVHDIALVVDNVLDSHCRGNHFARGAEMVELATLQGNDSHREFVQFWVVDSRMGT